MFKVTKRQVSFFIVLFIAWVLMFLLFFSANEITQAVTALKSANLWFIFVSIFIYLLAILVAVANIDFLMEKTCHKVSFLESFRITLIGYFVDSLLPNLISGGKITMAYLFKKREKVPIEKGCSVLILYTMGWFLGLTIFVTAILLYLFLFETFSTQLILIMGLLLVCFIAIFFAIIHVVTKPKSVEKLILFLIKFIFKIGLKFTHYRVFEKKVTHQAVDNARAFVHSFANQKKRGLVLFSSVLMFLHHLLMGLSFYMVLVAFGVEISLFFALGIYILIYMISLLSMIPGQFGVFELVAIPLLSLNTGLINSAVIIAVVRLIHYWMIVFIGGSFAIGVSIKRGRK